MSTGPDAPRPLAAASTGLPDTLRPGVVMLDTRGRIELWSHLAQEILGWPGRDVIGRPVGHVLATGDPNPRLLLAAILRDLRKDDRWAGTLALRRRDGRTVTAEVRARVLTDRDRHDHVLISLADTRLPRGAEHDLAPDGSAAAWTFPAEATAVREARARVRETLTAWNLRTLTDTAVLLVSELVTNSLRHAHGPIEVRMVRGPSLLFEVSDPLADPPRARAVAETDEGGRGMHLVAGSARSWGVRFGPLGKTVWFELPITTA
jgi:PAS domain S-box-containing protein